MKAAGRAGHSLPELIVAVTFLGATLGAVGAAARVGAGRTHDAALRQEAVRRAASVLDSLLADPAPGGGEDDGSGIRLRWQVAGEAADPYVEVVATAAGRELIRLGATWYAPAPVLPWPPEEP